MRPVLTTFRENAFSPDSTYGRSQAQRHSLRVFDTRHRRNCSRRQSFKIPRSCIRDAAEEYTVLHVPQFFEHGPYLIVGRIEFLQPEDIDIDNNTGASIP